MTACTPDSIKIEFERESRAGLLFVVTYSNGKSESVYTPEVSLNGLSVYEKVPVSVKVCLVTSYLDLFCGPSKEDEFWTNVGGEYLFLEASAQLSRVPA